MTVLGVISELHFFLDFGTWFDPGRDQFEPGDLYVGGGEGFNGRMYRVEVGALLDGGGGHGLKVTALLTCFFSAYLANFRPKSF